MAKCKCNLLPRLLRALSSFPNGDPRPAGGFDDEGMTGLPMTQGLVPLQETSWFGSSTTRDLAPAPAEVVLPLVLGFNPIPLETPVYDRGSYWRDDEWERV